MNRLLKGFGRLAFNDINLFDNIYYTILLFIISNLFKLGLLLLSELDKVKDSITTFNFAVILVILILSMCLIWGYKLRGFFWLNGLILVIAPATTINILNKTYTLISWGSLGLLTGLYLYFYFTGRIIFKRVKHEKSAYFVGDKQ